MTRWCVFIASCFIFLLSSKQINAQVKFSAIPSSYQVGKNERLQVDFKAENADVDNFSPPRFSGFMVESGPFTQSGMSIINGATSRYYIISFVLRPLKTGSWAIGPATASLDGHVYKTRPISILVTQNPQGSNVNPHSPFGGLSLDIPKPQPSRQFNDFILKKGENVQEKIAKNLFVKVEVDKTSCYVGEPVVATYKLYTRLKSESNLTKSPSFNGFSVLDLEIGNNYALTTEKLNGREYSVYVLRKVQLYPLQAGTFELDPAEVDNSITFLRADYANALGADALQDLLLSFAESSMPPEAVQTVRVGLASKTQAITINPLPEKGKPAGFKGAVGEFKLTSWLVKPHMSTDDAGNLRVNISGSGNIHMVNGVNVEWPAGVEGFDPKVTETLDKSTVPVSGEKQYAYPFSISKEGKYTIPPFEFSYFDPKTATYKVLNSSALPLEVIKGKGRKHSAITNRDTKVEASDVLMVLIYIAAVIGVVVAISFFLINRRKKKAEELEINSTIVPQPVTTLAEPEPAYLEPVIPVSPLIVPQEKLTEGDAPAFFSSLNQSMKEYLSKKLDIPYVELSKKRINEALDKKGANVHTSQLVCSLLDDIEMNLYAAPMAAHVQMQEVYEKANEVLGLIEKQIN